MNAAEKKRFIKDLCNAVRDDLLEKVKDMPECWDNVELRSLLAGKFAWQVSSLIRGKRGRAFRNEALTRNL